MPITVTMTHHHQVRQWHTCFLLSLSGDQSTAERGDYRRPGSKSGDQSTAERGDYRPPGSKSGDQSTAERWDYHRPGSSARPCPRSGVRRKPSADVPASVLVFLRTTWVTHTQYVSFPLLDIALLSEISLSLLGEETIQHKALGQSGLI